MNTLTEKLELKHPATSWLFGKEGLGFEDATMFEKYAQGDCKDLLEQGKKAYFVSLEDGRCYIADNPEGGFIEDMRKAPGAIRGICFVELRKLGIGKDQKTWATDKYTKPYNTILYDVQAGKGLESLEPDYK